MKPRAFTLIELLVVVTIIVVLLALLTPALDTAVYQAELATCSGRLHSGAVGVQQYAMDAKRSYPHREGPRDTTLNWGPSLLANRLYNDRPVIFSAVRPPLLLDPLGVRPNIETKVADNYITGNYDLWFGWTYLTNGETGMFRVGDRFTFNGKSYALLITDSDMITGNDGSAPADRYEGSSHPDRAGVMVKQGPYNDAVNPWPGWNLHGVYATWGTWTTQSRLQDRGPLDLNYAFDDASVQRVNDVLRDDERMDNVTSDNKQDATQLPGRRLQVPK